jgi:predicted enzyme related to lactoylglutathione lyase
MNRVVHFEIHGSDPDRLGEFYKGVFGWVINKWAGPVDYWLVDTGEGEGINGAIKHRAAEVGGESIIAYVCTIEVGDFDEAEAKIIDKGGTLVTGKMAIPGIGWHGYFKDPEGNVFGLIENERKG